MSKAFGDRHELSFPGFGADVQNAIASCRAQRFAFKMGTKPSRQRLRGQDIVGVHREACGLLSSERLPPPDDGSQTIANDSHKEPDYGNDEVRCPQDDPQRQVHAGQESYGAEASGEEDASSEGHRQEVQASDRWQEAQRDRRRRQSARRIEGGDGQFG